MLKKTTRLFAGLIVMGVGCHTSLGGTIDPRGVFFHHFTGPSSGVEWIHIWDLEGEDRYQFSDIRGFAPYDGEILGGGAITWDTLATQSGTGLFSDADNATMSLTYRGGQYESTMRRAAGTDADFITRIESRTDGDEGIEGDWDLQISSYDAATGAFLGQVDMGAATAVNNDLLTITYDDGTMFQGVFEEEDRAGFRVISGGVPAAYRTFAGSETSLNSNLLGDFRMTGENSFSATFLTQSRNINGPQILASYVVTGTRSVPTSGGIGVLGLGMVGLTCRRRRS